MPETTLLKWDETGKRYFEAGVSKGVLFPMGENGYGSGVAWSGLTAVNQSSEGGEPNAIYADDIKYLNLLSNEDFKATIEAYTYPDEWGECDGSAEIATGVRVFQQKRKPFGLSYVTKVGNDVDGVDLGYKIHLIYGGLAAPTDRNYETINDSLEPITFSWEVTTTPIALEGFKPTAHIEIDSTKVDATKLASFEQILYGTPAVIGTGTAENPQTPAVPARLPLPDEVYSHFHTA